MAYCIFAVSHFKFYGEAAGNIFCINIIVRKKLDNDINTVIF